MREDIKSMTLEELTAALGQMGEPAFRGKQIFSWLHRGARSFAEMSNLSKPLRERLAEKYYIDVPAAERKQVSRPIFRTIIQFRLQKTKISKHICIVSIVTIAY